MMEQNIEAELSALREENARLKAAQVQYEQTERALRDREAALRDLAQEQQQRETMYRQAIAAADGVVYQLDLANNRYTFMDELIEQLIGYSADEVVPALWSRIG